MNSNKKLNKAKSEKNDEFYTMYNTIESEIAHCAECFRGKTVYCPCDNPYRSNFVRFFVQNFNQLGLKRLIATNYAEEKQLSFFEDVTSDSEEESYCLDISEADENISFEEVLKKHPPYRLDGNGDYRSEECMKLMKEADIICTNPPFSLLRDFIKTVYKMKKEFLVLGNLLCFASPFSFSLLKKGEISMGFELRKGGRAKFLIPDDYDFSEAENFGVDKNGNRYIEVKGCSWISNLKKRYVSDFLELTESYSPEKYPCYDNKTDCINVDKTCDIPCDYNGLIGVPVSFIDKYNPAQFELIEARKGLFLNGKEVFTRIIIKIK